MAQNILTEEFEDALKSDCNKLSIILKTASNSDNKKDEDNLKILCRIIFLISYRQTSKMIVIRNYVLRYICQHPTLPITLVEILRDSKNMKICTYVLEILSKAIIKNNTTPESDRKCIRKLFSDPFNFKIIVESFHKLYIHFNNDKTNTLYYEMQLRFLKIINCLYVRKGHTQISLLSNYTIEFIGNLLNTYKSHKEISQSLLPLIKVLFRNKKNCSLICSDLFLNSLILVTPAVCKFATAVTILRLLSRNADAVIEMSKSEKLFSFILNVAITHSEKSVNKKHLMITLYRMTRNKAGVQNISKNQFWMLLLEFFMKTERFEDTRYRLAATKAYTILHRGIKMDSVTISPLKIQLDLPVQVQEYLNDKCKSQSDASDNEESEDEDENNNVDHGKNARERLSSDENYESEESEVESEAEDVEEEHIFINKDVNNSDHLTRMKPFFKELITNSEAIKPSEFKTNINKFINRQAFPDQVLAESDSNDINYVVADINNFAIESLAQKIRVLKELEETTFETKVAYDLDALIESEDESIIIPEPEIFKLEVLQADNKKTNRIVKNTPILHFESRFESGNLRSAEQVGEFEYNLFLSPDMNMTCGLQWFYFQVSHMLAGPVYTFNIVNFQKVNSQFNYGLQPVMFSAKDYVINNTGWRKVGEQLIYYGNDLINKETDKQFRTLSFNFAFSHNNDFCYFAYHFPYTYSRLLQMTTQLVNTKSNTINSRVDKLCSTVNGLNDILLITVTAKLNNEKSLNIPLEKRPLVFLTARVHPGESNSSWIMDGLLTFLMNENDERASSARENYIFKIMPMLNPEGVIYGNSRCGLTGNDLNRCWKKPHPILHPEIYYAKKVVQFAKEELKNPIFTFIDIHGHSRKKFFFLYGCNPKQSWSEHDKASADFGEATYNLLPKMLSSNENMKMSYCRYTIEKKRESTCRIVMWREFGIKRSYTLECSFCSGENKKKVTTKMLRDIGISIITSLSNILTTENAASFI